jgi:cobaltochelatase CobN
MHMGRHGTIEFLPGKNAGMAGWDAAEAILDDLPNPHFYITDGGGESTAARHRNHGALIGHLTPLVVAGGAQDEFRALRGAIGNSNRTAADSPSRAGKYRESALAEISRLKLDRQLGFDTRQTAWGDILDRVRQFLEATEAGPIPSGIHTLGALPSEEVRKEPPAG